MQETSYVWRFRVPPGWPAAPAGWWPPYGWVPDPRWPPASPGWAFWELVPVIRGPRARGLRVTILAAFFVSLAVGLLAMIVGILLWFERGIERSDYSSDYA